MANPGLSDVPQLFARFDSDAGSSGAARDRFEMLVTDLVKNSLATDDAGAQLIVVDNSPPESVADDIVIRFTRLADTPPYGLIPEATS